MAATGAVLFAFVIVHMIGNLQFYLGADQLNAYGRLLHEKPALVWGARAFLLAVVGLHVVSAVQMARQNRAARPDAYLKQAAVESSYASRTMYWSGPLLAAFIVYHLLHLTTGQAHPRYEFLNVYQNVVVGFSQPLAALAYIAAMVMLGMHLYHGAWSMFQSVGWNHPRYTPVLRRFAKTMAFVLAAGNCSIPIAVLAGFYDHAAVRF